MADATVSLRGVWAGSGAELTTVSGAGAVGTLAAYDGSAIDVTVTLVGVKAGGRIDIAVSLTGVWAGPRGGNSAVIQAPDVTVMVSGSGELGTLGFAIDSAADGDILIANYTLIDGSSDYGSEADLSGLEAASALGSVIAGAVAVAELVGQHTTGLVSNLSVTIDQGLTFLSGLQAAGQVGSMTFNTGHGVSGVAGRGRVNSVGVRTGLWTDVPQAIVETWTTVEPVAATWVDA